ncbi:unnamed protein product [Cuscuta epithymum]|uniref:Uncharacterized protein n=1 Tax=Cuscuta epithymum TaxID=186058 RepID=A0AAV0F7V0_9ASTE|nr:unnamed protein product [Cuscuta epithymum]
MVSSPRPQGIVEMNVAALIKEDKSGWNLPRLREFFSPEERTAILSIPISRRDTTDSYWWNGEARGAYTVKSGYRILKGECLMAGEHVEIDYYVGFLHLTKD